MSVKATAKVWELDLPRPEKTVLLAMADHADHEGRNIYPGIGLLAWKTDYSTRQVQRIINDLLDMKVLELDSDCYGQYGTNLYHINWTACKFKDAYRAKEPRQRRKPSDILSLPETDNSDEGSDILTPPPSDILSGGDDILSHDILYIGSDISSTPSDIAMSPKPSINRQEPSVNDSPYVESLFNETQENEIVSPTVATKKSKTKPLPKKEPKLIWPEGFNLDLLWVLVQSQQMAKLEWNWGKQTKAVNAIVTQYPEATEQDLADFLAYKRTVFRADPLKQIEFTPYQHDYGLWLTDGKPKQVTRGENNGRQQNGSFAGTVKSRAADESFGEAMGRRANRLARTDDYEVPLGG